MFQLYKKRNFSTFIGDTFTFFKIYGKAYFKNYFIINGGFLLLLVVFFYLYIKILMESLFSGLQNSTENPFAFFNLNPFVFLSVVLFAFIIIIIVSLLSYLYPLSFLQIISHKEDIGTKNLWLHVKQNIGKSLVFFLASLITFVPILIICTLLLVFLTFIIIGIPLMLVVIPAIFSWITLTYYEYCSTKKGFFESMGIAFNLITKNFWNIVGSTIVMYLIINTIIGIIYIFSAIISGVLQFTSPEQLQQTNGNESFTFISIMVGIIFSLLIITSYTLQNLLIINQGIIYYSQKDAIDNISTSLEIDAIGSNDE